MTDSSRHAVSPTDDEFLAAGFDPEQVVGYDFPIDSTVDEAWAEGVVADCLRPSGVAVRCAVCLVLNVEKKATVLTFLAPRPEPDHGGNLVWLLWATRQQVITGEGKRFRVTAPDWDHPLGPRSDTGVGLRCRGCGQRTEKVTARSVLRLVQEVGPFGAYLPRPPRGLA